MIWRKRSELRPGEKFAVESGPYGRGYHLPDVYVVLDAETEVGFFRGGISCYGTIAPSRKVLTI